MVDSTLASQLTRYEAVRNAPESKRHTVLRRRIYTWKDADIGVYIALIPEVMTQGSTEENAVKSAESVIRQMAEWVTDSVRTELLAHISRTKEVLQKEYAYTPASQAEDAEAVDVEGRSAPSGALRYRRLSGRYEELLRVERILKGEK